VFALITTLFVGHVAKQVVTIRMYRALRLLARAAG